MEWTKVRTVVFLLALVFVPLVFLSLAYYAGLPSKPLSDEILSRPMFRPVLCRSMSSTTATPYDVPSSGPGVFETIVTLCEPPELNKAVPVLISVRNNEPRIQPKVTIEAVLFKRTYPWDWIIGRTVWTKVLWEGDMPSNALRTFRTEVKVEEPGLYAFTGGVAEPGLSFNFFSLSGQSIFMNVTEHSTKASTTNVLEEGPLPFPYVNYMIETEMDEVPVLNRPVNLSVYIAPFNLDTVTFKIILPEGFELVSGDLVWKGVVEPPTGIMEELWKQNLRGRPFPNLQNRSGRGLEFNWLENLSGTAYEEEGSIVKTLFRYGFYPRDKMVHMQATVKAVKTGDWTIVVLPMKGDPGFKCTGEVVHYPLKTDPPIPPDRPDLIWWGTSSIGGCLRIRVLSETDAIVTSVGDLPNNVSPSK